MHSVYWLLSLSPFIGALMNRLRGGLINHGSAVSLVVLMILVYFVSSGNVWLAIATTFGMWFGESFGWGRYIGALGGWEDKELKEVKAIDFFIKPLINKPKLWGFAGLTLRGMLWTFFVALTIVYFIGVKLAILLTLSGLSMGVCYWLTTMKWGRLGWPYGEWLFGAVLWPSILTVIFMSVN